MKIKLRGRRWNLVAADSLHLPDLYGYTEAPDKPGKRIVIVRDQASRDLLDTTIHEMLHACLPDMSEDAVLETATDIATVLHRLGARIALPAEGNQ